jgi:hypothetical protein
VILFDPKSAENHLFHRFVIKNNLIGLFRISVRDEQIPFTGVFDLKIEQFIFIQIRDVGLGLSCRRCE